jgi:NDP-sugar pyrophosphorylase family protein
MFLAAGLGTRLRPLTSTTPKALIPVMGRPMLDWAMAHVGAEGIREVIINLHHFPDAISEHVEHRRGYGMGVAFSRESTLMGTGGGVKKAEWFLKDRPFVLRNVDVLAGFPVRPLLERLQHGGVVAALAVQHRETSRALLWDGDGHLCGRLSHARPDVVRRPRGRVEPLGFTGIHALSPRVFEMMPVGEPFCIVEFYLDLARRGETIACHQVDQFYWRDLGTHESLKKAEAELAEADEKLLRALGITSADQCHRDQGHSEPHAPAPRLYPSE